MWWQQSVGYDGIGYIIGVVVVLFVTLFFTIRGDFAMFFSMKDEDRLRKFCDEEEGMKFVPEGLGSSRMRGTMRGYAVEVVPSLDRRMKFQIEIPPVAVGFKLRQRRSHHPVQGVSGDREFDELFNIQTSADASQRALLLNEELRFRFKRSKAFVRTIVIEDHRVEVDSKIAVYTDEVLRGLVMEVVEMAACYDRGQRAVGAASGEERVEEERVKEEPSEEQAKSVEVVEIW